jgi:hypothetical protein
MRGAWTKWKLAAPVYRIDRGVWDGTGSRPTGVALTGFVGMNHGGIAVKEDLKRNEASVVCTVQGLIMLFERQNGYRTGCWRPCFWGVPAERPRGFETESLTERDCMCEYANMPDNTFADTKSSRSP